jgi:hypothetical protein
LLLHDDLNNFEFESGRISKGGTFIYSGNSQKVKHNISTVVRKRRRSDEHVRQADSGRPRTIQGGKKECIKDEMMAIQTEAPKNVCSKF